MVESFADFGLWDWACLAYSLSLAFAGIFALKCLWQLPGTEYSRSSKRVDTVIGLVAALLGFGLLFPLVTQFVALQFVNYIGISQAHLFAAAFTAQVVTTVAFAITSWALPGALDWAPSIRQPDTEPSPESPFRQALRAFSIGRLLLVLLAIFTLGVVGTLLWKGIHLGWAELFLRGWAGPPPVDEPQDIVDAVLKADVNTWRFGMITLAVVVGAPIMEELAFRGMMYPALKFTVGSLNPNKAPLIAAIITGIVFSAAHASPSAAIPLFAFGFLMCFARDRFGLVTCMAIHASFNLSNLVWLKLAPNAANF